MPFSEPLFLPVLFNVYVICLMFLRIKYTPGCRSYMDYMFMYL